MSLPFIEGAEGTSIFELTLSWGRRGLVLRQRRSFGVHQVVVKVLHFLSDGVHLVAVFVEYVFAHKLGRLKLLAAQRTQPLVFAELLSIGRQELLHLRATK